MSILSAWRATIMSSRWWSRSAVARLVTLFCLRRCAFRAGLASVGRWAFSFRSMVIATPASGTFTLVFALMLGVALGRRRFIDPRRQHFQVDQFVEFKRRVSHECFLLQAANKTSA